MPLFTSFALQFSNTTAEGLAKTGAQLLITESAIGITNAPPTMTHAELAQLADAGKVVLAYVNTSVTDASRSYWNPAWVTPSDPAEPDVGTVNATAPAWLLNNLGGADFAPEPNGAPAADEAIRVDYRNADWQALVISQAVAQVQAGYGGVFLDDVGQYYAAGYQSGSYDPSLADEMMTFVIKVAAAVRAINPDAVVIVNSGVYIGGDSTDGTSGALFAAYRAAINGMIIENQFATEATAPGVLSAALDIYPGLSILALESAAGGVDPGQLLGFAGTHPGLLTYVVPDETYSSFVRTPLLGTAAANKLVGAAGFAHLIGGLGGNDRITGWRLDDSLYGHEGNDKVYGGTGGDRLRGGAGNDGLYGGSENDTLMGDAGLDRLYGDAGDDNLAGGDGLDRLFGGKGADRLSGGLGDDLLYGGRGADQFVFDLNNGQDKVVDFTQGRDQLDLHNLNVTLAEVQAAMHLVKGGILLDFVQIGGLGSVFLQGQKSLAAFTADDFIL